jgi:hypothetical protein
VPLPPARVPAALTRRGDADHGLGQQHEAGDHAGRQQPHGSVENHQVAQRRDDVEHRAHAREHAQRAAGSTLAGRVLQAGQLEHRPQRPDEHGSHHHPAQQAAVADHQRGELRTEVHERGGGAEHCRQQQADGDGDVEAGPLLHEQDAGGPDGVQQQELAGAQEREREQQHARVTSPVCRLAGGVGQAGGAGTHGQEQHEVQPRVGEVGVQVGAHQQRDQPDHRQQGREHPRHRRQPVRPPPRPRRFCSSRAHCTTPASAAPVAAACGDARPVWSARTPFRARRSGTARISPLTHVRRPAT